MFTRRHYKKIADGIKEAIDNYEGKAPIPAQIILFSLCDIFGNDNPKFSEEKFLNYCLGKDNPYAKKTYTPKSS